MPIYEYRCNDCGHELEKLQRMSEAPLTDCPACGKAALRRLISASGFRLKGSGWYETDFKKDNKRNVADSSASSSSGDSGKSESSGSSDSGSEKSKSGSDSSPKSDTKSDSKSDTKSSTKPESKNSTSA